MLIFKTKRTEALERIATSLEALVNILDTGDTAQISSNLISIGKNKAIADIIDYTPKDKRFDPITSNNKNGPWEEDNFEREVRERMVTDGFT